MSTNRRKAGAREKATAAGVYDFFLGGKHHHPIDEQAAIASQGMLPRGGDTVRDNRAFLGRAVEYLVRQGVHQFLDLGSGYPSAGNVHEVAQAGAPGAKVVYVDHEPDTVAVSQRILDGNPNAVSVLGDARDVDSLVSRPEVAGLLDFDQPIALLMIAILQFVPDAEELEVVPRWLSHLAPGSYLALTHPSLPATPRAREKYVEFFELYNSRVTERAVIRDDDQIAALFAGTTLVPPGVVHVSTWDPDNPDAIEPTTDEAESMIAGGIGRVR